MNSRFTEAIFAGALFCVILYASYTFRKTSPLHNFSRASKIAIALAQGVFFGVLWYFLHGWISN
jgi:uncharacterized membrane protein